MTRAIILPVVNLTYNKILVMQTVAFLGRPIARILAATWLMAILLPAASTQARESITSVPSARLVLGFFDDLVKIIFLNANISTNLTGQDQDTQRQTEIRDILARAIDAKSISRFILGRYANSHQPPNQAPGSMPTITPAKPEDGFLDFAAASVMRLTPHHDAKPGASPLPVLSILTVTMRPDQTRLVQSELIMSDGRRLPLTWEVADRPAGLQIEDVTCLGISLRLMLRSAVAEAAAEHPDQVYDLSQLLGIGHAFTQFAPAAGLGQ